MAFNTSITARWTILSSKVAMRAPQPPVWLWYVTYEMARRRHAVDPFAQVLKVCLSLSVGLHVTLSTPGRPSVMAT